MYLEYTAKSAWHREQAIAEDQVCAVVRGLKRCAAAETSYSCSAAGLGGTT